LSAQAERKRLHLRVTDGGRRTAAIAELMSMYEDAFEMALENGFVQDAALAKELAFQVRSVLLYADFVKIGVLCLTTLWSAQVINEVADQCRAESLYCLGKWGADAVVRNRKAAADGVIEETLSDNKLMRNVDPYSTTDIVASALDLDAVIHASQQLSSKLDTKELLRSALGLILDITGSTKVSGPKLRPFFNTKVVLCVHACVLICQSCFQGVILLLDDANTALYEDSDKSSSSSSSEVMVNELFIRAKGKSTYADVRAHFKALLATSCCAQCFTLLHLLFSMQRKVRVKKLPFTTVAHDLPNSILNYCWHAKGCAPQRSSRTS
jgi:hypothetical protein